MAKLTLAELREAATYVGGRNYTCDETEHSAVIVCLRPGCDWRYVAHHRAVALQKYATHCGGTHSDSDSADKDASRARTLARTAAIEARKKA